MPVLDQPEDLRRVEQLARALPPVTRALVPDDGSGEVPEPSASRPLLKDFVGALVDAAVRTWALPLPLVIARRDILLRSWLTALFSPSEDPLIDAPIQDLEKLQDDVARWLERLATGTEPSFRICFRLESPDLGEPHDPNAAESMFRWRPMAGGCVSSSRPVTIPVS